MSSHRGCTTRDRGRVLLKIGLMVQRLLDNDLIVPRQARTCKVGTSCTGVLPALLQSRRRKSSRCLGQKEKLSSGSWMGCGFFLLQAGKTHDEGEEEGKMDRSRTGGTLGQAASVTQRNGLATLSGSPCSEPSLLIAHTPRAHQPAHPGSKGERAISSKRRRQLHPDSLSQPRHTLC